MIILNSAISAAALVFYLPVMCTHTDTEGKQSKVRVRKYFKIFEKTQYLMNTLYIHNTGIQTDGRTSSVEVLSPEKATDGQMIILFNENNFAHNIFYC